MYSFFSFENHIINNEVIIQTNLYPKFEMLNLSNSNLLIEKGQ